MNTLTLRGRVSVLLLCGGSAALTACGGGGDYKPPAAVPPAPVALSGSVSAPSGTLALMQRRGIVDRVLAGLVPSAYAQTTGLAPVPNTNILVFRVNNDGTPNGAVLASTTTNNNGNWTLNLPAGVALGGNLVVQATGQNTPRAIGQPNQQNCPVTQPTLPIAPAAEYATRALIAGVARNASNLGNFTTAEINAIIQRVFSLTQDPNLVGSTIQQTIDNITAQVDPETRRLIDGAASSGEATAPTGLGGTYNIVSFGGEDQGGTRQFQQETGTVSIDVAARTFAVSSSTTRTRLAETCTATQQAPCARSFARSSSTGTDSTSGAITLLGGNQIAFQPADNDGGALGSYNAAGNVIVIAQGEAGGLIVAIKQPGATVTVSGNYQAAELNGQLAGSFDVVAGSPFDLGRVSNGTDTLSVNNSAGTGNSSGSAMSKTITCNGQATCSSTEALTQSNDGGAFTFSISASNAGVLSVTPGDGGPISGAVAGDGQFFVLANGHPATDGDSGLVLGVKQGTGMNNASLTGSYTFAAISFELGSQSSSARTESGTVAFNGAGGFSASLFDAERRQNTSCSNGVCPANTQSQSSGASSPAGNYAVSSSGGVTFSGGDVDGTITGYASADAKYIVMTEASDGVIGGQANGSSSRGLFLMIK